MQRRRTTERGWIFIFWISHGSFKNYSFDLLDSPRLKIIYIRLQRALITTNQMRTEKRYPGSWLSPFLPDGSADYPNRILDYYKSHLTYTFCFHSPRNYLHRDDTNFYFPSISRSPSRVATPLFGIILSLVILMIVAVLKSSALRSSKAYGGINVCQPRLCSSRQRRAKRERKMKSSGENEELRDICPSTESHDRILFFLAAR